MPFYGTQILKEFSKDFNLEKERVKRRKIEQEEKFQHITIALKQATPPYCKRSIPTLNQIRRFLKKEKRVSASILSTISMDNICEKWDAFWEILRIWYYIQT